MPKFILLNLKNFENTLTDFTYIEQSALKSRF